MERLEAIVSGRVQLVMYRDFVCRNARAEKLVGEVENMPDGTVRIVAEGPRVVLDKFALKLWKGSLLSKVEMVRTIFAPATGTFSTFKILF